MQHGSQAKKSIKNAVYYLQEQGMYNVNTKSAIG
jgi:hypothetical protein